MTPPRHEITTSPHSVSARTWTSTRCTTKRIISLRSAAVVSGAFQSVGRSLDRARIRARWSSLRCGGCSFKRRSYSSARLRRFRSASSHCRSKLRATRRFSGSTAWYCRSTQHPTQRVRTGRAPFQPTASRSSVEAHPQEDLIPYQTAVETLAGAQFVELVEDQLHGRLHPLVRIAGDFPGGQLDIPTGDVEEQRAPVGLVQPATFQSIMHEN